MRSPNASVWTARLIILGVMMLLWLRYPANFDSYRHGVPGDFAVYLKASERIAHGVSPYVASDPSPYKYSPGVLALFRLFPDATPEKAWFVFGTLSILALGAGLWRGSRYRSWREVGLLGVGLLLAWKGILETLDYGQLELMIFGLATLAGAWIASLPVASGLVAGVLPWLKLPWGLLFFPLLLSVRNDKRSRFPQFISGYFFACFLFGAAIPALILGSDRSMQLSQNWVELLKTQPKGLYQSFINQSLWVSNERWWGDSQPTRLALGLGLMIASIFMGVLMQQSLRHRLDARRTSFQVLSGWIIFNQLVNPLAWRWGSVYAAGIPLATTQESRSGASNARQKLAWGLVLALWLLQLNPVTKVLGFGHWTDLHPYGSVTLFWLSLLFVSLV